MFRVTPGTVCMAFLQSLVCSTQSLKFISHMVHKYLILGMDSLPDRQKRISVPSSLCGNCYLVGERMRPVKWCRDLTDVCTGFWRGEQSEGAL